MNFDTIERMTETGDRKPLGRTLWDVSRLTARAFDRVLIEHGGNRPIWFVFLALDAGDHTTQRGLAAGVGINEATLTHHLAALESRGLIRRTRDESDRRVQRIAFTNEGRVTFEAMRDAAVAFETQMLEALGSETASSLRSGLAQLAQIVEGACDDSSSRLNE